MRRRPALSTRSIVLLGILTVSLSHCMLVIPHLPYDDTTHESLLAIYNPLGRSWSSPLVFYDHTLKGHLEALGGKLYLISEYSHFTVFDPGDSSWTTLDDVFVQRHRAVTAVVREKLCYTGGYSTAAQTLNSDLAVFDPVQNEWNLSSRLPTATQGAAAVVFRDRLHVIGGCTGTPSPSDAVLDHQVYDLQENAWISCPALPEPVWGGVAAVSGDRIFLLGGGDPDQSDASLGSRQVRYYDGTTGFWRDASEAPFRIHDLPVASLDGIIYLIRPIEGQRAQLYAFDPSGDSWTPVALLPREMEGVSDMTVRNGRLIVLGWREVYL